MEVRTLIYARYSSELQNSRSIDDQIAICCERADRESWPIVDVFADRAISGAAGIGADARPGFHALMQRLEAGDIDQVLAEATDRMSRHQGDSYQILELLTYHKVRLFTLSDGEITELNGTIKGLMDSQFRKNLADKIRRGQRGSVSAGRVPAGIAYGYRSANQIDDKGLPIRGLRAIDENHAHIVRRIFTDFAKGKSPLAIARELNHERIASPRGGEWCVSTITGDRKRQHGILQNQLYVGRLVHNRTSKVVEPLSRRERIRPNAEDDWLIADVPDLRIIDDATWLQVGALRARWEGLPVNRTRRPKFLLSGLATCGSCGGSWIAIGGGRTGCGSRRAGSNCTNGRTIMAELLEARVLSGLQQRMLNPELVDAFVEEYKREYQRQSKMLRGDRSRLERQHREASQKVNRLVSALAEGASEFVEIKDVLARTRNDRDCAARELEMLESLPAIVLHPAIVADYRSQIGALHEVLNESPEARAGGMPIVRSLIDAVVVSPTKTGRGVSVQLRGRLAPIIALATGQPAPDNCMLIMERVKGS